MNHKEVLETVRKANLYYEPRYFSHREVLVVLDQTAYRLDGANTYQIASALFVSNAVARKSLLALERVGAVTRSKYGNTPHVWKVTS